MKKNKVDFDVYTDNYNSLLREGTGFFTDSDAYFARYKVDILRGEVPSGTNSVLEYGCGIGRNIPFLKAAFPDAKISGSDISAASLYIARMENPGIEFFLEEAGSDNNKTYDVIFIAGVFHHIPLQDRSAVMISLFQRLVPGGFILVFEHNPFNPITRKIVNQCPYDKDALLLKPSHLRNLLLIANFQIIRSAYCLFIPPKISALLPLESKLHWLPFGGQYWIKATRTA